MSELPQVHTRTCTHTQTHAVNVQEKAEADKVMCNGVECPEGQMCMRGSGAPYCMKMRV